MNPTDSDKLRELLRQPFLALGALPANPDPKPYRPFTHFPAAEGAGFEQASVFEPATKPLDCSFRECDPVFRDPADGIRWRAARGRAMDHLLRLIAESPWVENLILRGSRLLAGWLGEAARDPGDLDFVVIPNAVGIRDPWTTEMFVGLAHAVARRSPPEGLTFLAEPPEIDDLWTYDRVPGKRIAFRWRTPGLPPGTIRLDFVFGELMPESPVPMSVPLRDGPPVTLLAAGPELSLAWKLQWLDNDLHPQGKDLYDAVLLAERIGWSERLETLVGGLRFDRRERRPHGPMGDDDCFRVSPLHELPAKWYGRSLEWDDFRQEFPHIPGTQAEWRGRLASALDPSRPGRADG